ncbi:hypothetical protein Vretifemale_19875 [Volvox reticuliferus]|uniref:Uncharacterized protein n=1 Tax=Volvox reticuliferus TaxID=1737510 RepID=A0A8J4CYS4_9CHLO|nr:hypothetical protein Vretifemale_19875 [Volvox reticuliferus]
MAANEPLGHGTPDEISEIIKEEVWPNPVKYYYSLAQGQREYEDVVDEGALVEAEDLEGVLVQAADEGEGEEELVYDEGEGELDALGGDEGDGGAEGGTGFADDEGEGAPGL